MLNAELAVCARPFLLCLQLSVDDMLAKCNTGTDLQQARSTLTTLKSYAASFGLPLATYEAGPSIMVRLAGQKSPLAAVWPMSCCCPLAPSVAPIDVCANVVA